jgi:hypothetical protein
MRAAVIEGKHLPVVIDNEKGTASAANDSLTRGPQLLQGRRANEVRRMGGKVLAGAHFGHCLIRRVTELVGGSESPEARGPDNGNLSVL